jgi:two-component system, LytTR family, response regulator LytT
MNNTKIEILIVEDEAIIAENIKMTIEDFGYEVAGVCYNYDDALVRITNEKFDLIMLDINLGSHFEKTGLELAALLQEENKTPFIFLTAFSDVDTINKAAKLNPSAYLVKPVNSPSLFAAIQTAIENFNSKSKAKLPGEVSTVVDHFFVKHGAKISKVNWLDVYAISSVKNYVKFVTSENKSGYLMRASLNIALQKIVPMPFRQKFIQINRSTAINKDIILAVEAEKIATTFGDFEASHTFLQQLHKLD